MAAPGEWVDADQPLVRLSGRLHAYPRGCDGAPVRALSAPKPANTKPAIRTEDTMDKQRVKQTILDPEQKHFDASREASPQYVSSARIDTSAPIGTEDQDKTELARDLATAFS